ncbi:MAG TPA: SIR2 family protein [Pyrinomonadaceae bacterium]|nr:SIR2 family protein [Pyrinomonadaceae bacterium]
MTDRLDKADWELLLERIVNGKCTPFLGAGACYGVLPVASKIAESWAAEEDFPFDDCGDLAKVAQFLAVKYDPSYPKDKLIKQFRNVAPPDFSNPYEPHALLASLPLPVYITTNYDDFMYQALKRSEYSPGYKKVPVQEICRWNRYVKNNLRGKNSVLEQSPYSDINEQRPIVYHLHGSLEMAESMVLTEDDYLDFLMNISEDENLLPPRIQQAMAGTSLLFIGYRLSDWNFRVLFRNVVRYMERSIIKRHISVQLVPVRSDASKEQRQRVQEYLHRYFGDLKIKVYWGPAEEFTKELRDRWEEYKRR